jgi:hypothetical protein
MRPTYSYYGNIDIERVRRRIVDRIMRYGTQSRHDLLVALGPYRHPDNAAQMIKDFDAAVSWLTCDEMLFTRCVDGVIMYSLREGG